MELPTKCILDGDILAYRAAFYADAEGIDCLEERLEHDVRDWTWGDEAPTLAFSCPRSQNWRRAYWPDYKAHRDGAAKPDCMAYTLEYLYDSFECICFDKLEADDLMGIGTSRGEALSVTIDKDLRGVPGWHWNPDKEEEPVYITPEEAYRFFITQWMTGDSTDNIPGLWRVGPKKAEKYLDEVDRADWVDLVLHLYQEEKRPEGKKVDDPLSFALSQALCVRILQGTDIGQLDDLDIVNTMKNWEIPLGPSL